MMSLDEQIFLAVNQGLQHSWSVHLFCLVTWLGNGIVLALLILPSLYLFDRKALKQHAVPLVIVVVLSGVVVNVMKPAIGRSRPPEHFAPQGIVVNTPMGVPSDRSFPSGHTQTAFSAAAYLACMYPVAAAPLVLAACLVGMSRIVLGVHYPLDVLTGAAVGILFAVAGFYINRRRLRSAVD